MWVTRFTITACFFTFFYFNATLMGPPVLFGHYWFFGQPAVISPQFACVDYGVAKDGPHPLSARKPIESRRQFPPMPAPRATSLCVDMRVLSASGWNVNQ